MSNPPRGRGNFRGGGGPNRGQSSNSGGAGRGGSPRVCHNCDQPGHIQADCPHPRRGRGGGGGPLTCHLCGKPGHKAFQCPTGQGQSAGGPPQSGQSSTIPVHGGPPSGYIASNTPNAPARDVRPGIYQGALSEPDASVTKAENELVKVTRDKMFDGFPGRRGYGTLGDAIRVRTNYLKLNNIADKSWYRYNVAIAPELSKQKKRRVFTAILSDPLFSNANCASDFNGIILTTEKLELGKEEEWRKKITVPAATVSGLPSGAPGPPQGPVPDFVQAARERNTVEIKVTYASSFSLGGLIQYLQSPSPAAVFADHNEVIQLLNIILCMAPQSDPSLVNVGQNVFYPILPNQLRQSEKLGGGLVALRGYYISARPAINRILVNLNVASGAFYLHDMVENVLVDANLNRDMAKAERFIRLLKVEVDYGKGKEKKIKTITGLAKQPRYGNATNVRFQWTDASGVQSLISVEGYFRQAHGITLQKAFLPVLNTGTLSNPQYVPMELCKVLDGQPYRRLLEGEQTSVMLRFAARFPNQNAMSIAGTPGAPGDGVKLFHIASAPGPQAQDPQSRTIRPWGVSVDADMLVVPARILQPPRVNYRSKNLFPALGSWNCAKQQFYIGGNVGKWQVLIINRQKNEKETLNALSGNDSAKQTLLGAFGKALTSYGIRSERVNTQTITLNPLSDNNRPSNNAILEKAFQNAKAQNVRMLFVVLQNDDKWVYSRIKVFGDIKYGIHTINTVGKKFEKPGNLQDMFFGNLALKFNIKGGGVCHNIPNTLSKPLDKLTMLIGIDVTHPSPGSTEGAPSIAAMVANTDEHLCQWPGSIRTQRGRQEMVEGLEEMMLERLDLWKQKNSGQLPNKIVIYRDGVSESQYGQILQFEIPPIQEAFKKRYGLQEAKWPKVAVIVVGKRHHTRFYPMKQNEADFNADRNRGSWNPVPGTIVDRGIANRVLREFWLQAHQGLQGTARPAHYVVIKDDIKFEADDMERITHNMCYTFNRAPKAVSICPPAYYADLLCERGRFYLQDVFAGTASSDGSAFNEATAEWTKDVHVSLKESTWYI